MGYNKWGKEISFADLAVSKSLEHNRSVKMMDSEACAKHLAEQRWPNGFVCPRCGHKEGWYLSKRELFDCKSCRFQTSVTAGLRKKFRKV